MQIYRWFRCLYFDAELIRRIGEVRLLVSPREREEAAQDFRRAIDIARRQGARTLELRAALALARVLLTEGQSTDAQSRTHNLRSKPAIAAIPADSALTEAVEAPALMSEIR